mgnify:CR=1 FL=1
MVGIEVRVNSEVITGGPGESRPDTHSNGGSRPRREDGSVHTVVRMGIPGEVGTKEMVNMVTRADRQKDISGVEFMWNG